MNARTIDDRGWKMKVGCHTSARLVPHWFVRLLQPQPRNYEMISLGKIERFAHLALVLPLSVSVACDDRAEPRVTTHQQDSRALHEDPAEDHS